jgi:hypothetical protein
MKYSEFCAICEEKLIAPEIAMENDYIRVALKAKNDDLVKKLLDDEF